MKEIEKFQTYLLEKERSENTIDSYTRSVKIFFDQYDDISKKNMLDFKKSQMEKRKPKTANNRVAAMNQYCIFAGHPEYCIKQVKIHESTSVENAITLQEYKKILEGLKADGDMRGYWMIQYLAKTGARVGEFIRLTRKSLETGYCEMWTKGKIRRIYIPQQLIKESKSYFDKQGESEYLFPSRYGTMITTNGVASRIRFLAKKYGIRKEVAHPHAFRHLFAIEFLKHNNNIALLADLMGHSNAATTSIYLRLSQEEQMRQLNEASNW